MIALSDIFKFLDANSDGHIDGGDVDLAVANLDTNKNGVISQPELWAQTQTMLEHMCRETAKTNRQ